MLRITTHDSEEQVHIVLEGRVAGAWAKELERVWAELVPKIASKKLSIDMREVTYADESGKQVLVKMSSHGDTEMLAGTLGTQYLAKQIRDRSNAERAQEVKNADRA